MRETKNGNAGFTSLPGTLKGSLFGMDVPQGPLTMSATIIFRFWDTAIVDTTSLLKPFVPAVGQTRSPQKEA